ncbi:MAG: GNAT family N-acetyltransferase, partial [Alphaproteobacteria bacterium]
MENHQGLPIGEAVEYRLADLPRKTPLHGQFCRLEPFDLERHTEDLFAAYLTDDGGKNWTYLPFSAFDDLEKFRNWIGETCAKNDPFF